MGPAWSRASWRAASGERAPTIVATRPTFQPADDPAVFLLDGLQCSWVRDANVLADLLSAGIVPATKAARVTRRSLSAFVLVGPAPAYTTHPPSEPERTKPTDFAGHRPNG